MSKNRNVEQVNKVINGLYILLTIEIVVGFITHSIPNARVGILLICQFIILLVCRPIMNAIYRMQWLKRLKKKKEEFFAVDRTIDTAYRVGECMATQWCAAVLFLFAAFIFLGIRIWWENVRFIDILSGIAVPLLMASILVWETFEQAVDMPATKGLEPFKLEAIQHQHKLWIIINQTGFSVNSRRDTYVQSDGHKDTAYLITKDELYHVLPKGMSEQEFIEINPRCCYLIHVTMQQDLEKTFDRVYEEYLESGNDGLRKIVVLNLRTSTVQKRLVIPDKYQRQEFLYYAELKRLDDLTYQFLGSICGDNLDNFSIDVNTEDKKDITSEERHKNIENQKKNFDETHLHYFEHPDVFRQRINESVTYNNDIRIKNTWLKDFYNSACVFQNPSRSAMALMDYWELLLRLQSIYYYQMMETPKIREEELVHANLMTLGRFLVEASTFYPEHHLLLDEKEFGVPEVIHVYLDKLKDFIYIHFSGENVSFLGLISLIQVLRNKIVAHGVMNDESASIVWGIMYWATELLNFYLLLSDFQLKEADDTYELGFDTTVQAGKFIMVRDGCPCIAAIQKSNKKSYIYVNFFDGKLIAPEYVEVNPK